MNLSLDGKVAIVTGARPGGIGAAYARGLAQAGAAVVVADVDGEGAAAMAADLGGEGHRAIGVRTDITDPASTQAMAEAAAQAFGGIDILVNNAALMAEIPQVPTEKLSLDWWNRVMAVNLTGAFLCCQAVIPAMRARGGGRIINQASGGAFIPRNAYGVSKLGVVGLTVVLAKELGPDKITVNAIAPGFVTSDAGKIIAPEDSPFRQYLKQNVYMREIGEPNDLVGPLLFLASDAGGWMTGQTLNVDGGWVMRI
jgi:NAD(P)-dependent dehydrogenase (short-subunit alcohol dehydrogenase family)